MTTSKIYALFEFYEENSIDIGKVGWIEEPDVDSIELNKTEVLVNWPKNAAEGKDVEIIPSMARVIKFAGRCS